MKLRTNKFPCPHCQGEGTWNEFCLDSGECLTDSCGTCDGEGMLTPLSDGYKFIVESHLFESVYKLCPYVDNNDGVRLTPFQFRQVQRLITQLIELGSSQDSWSDDEFCRGCDKTLLKNAHTLDHWHDFGVCSKECLDFVNQRMEY